MPEPRLRALAVLAAAACWPALADEQRDRPIQDNSFLLEEAYNQEPGVIQHISLFLREPVSGNWAYSFTEEWPAGGLTHQVSATVQVLRSDGSGTPRTGMGDVLLNYRWQAVGSGDEAIAVAPRVSVVLPTADWRRGLGTGGLGAQVNLPVSIELGRWLVTHFNLGGTWFPSAHTTDGNGRSVGVNLGQGLVFLVHRRVNLMLEVAYTVTEIATSTGTVRLDAFLVSPGIRAALDLPLGLQVVPGVAFPFGFGPGGGDRAILGYLSFEHPITRAAREAAAD